jgi:energy-coupling factor transport system ATP-binding protein
MRIRLDGFRYRYPGAPAPALDGLSLSLPAGLTLVTGASGSGKSTLLRALNGLVPHASGGTVAGRVRVGELDPVALGPGPMSAVVGFVSGDPERAAVMDRVADEVAFALENRGPDRAILRRRVAGALARVGLAEQADRPLAGLSGGERQRVQVAAALALGPRVLVLDEPTSQLDDAAAAQVLDAVTALAAAGDLTVVLAEHRLDRVAPRADWQLHLADGRLAAAGPPDLLRAQLGRPRAAAPPPARTGPIRLAIDELRFGYGPRRVLDGVRLAVRAGEVVALTGPSGSGKSTLLALAVGLLRPEGGQVEVAGRPTAGRRTAEICRDVAFLPQDPDALLGAAGTARGELLETLGNHGLAADGAHDPDRLLARVGLEGLAECYPRDLSTGQRQRLALAAVAVTRPGLWLLDEPTRGLDDAAIVALAALLQEAAGAGAAVLVASHDRRLVRATHRQVRLVDGRLLPEASAGLS